VVTWSDEEKLRQRPKALVLVSSEYLCGFEALGLTQRSHDHLLEHSWVSGSIPISMKVVNGNGGGC
jgi:hypothetical protein